MISENINQLIPWRNERDNRAEDMPLIDSETTNITKPARKHVQGETESPPAILNAQKYCSHSLIHTLYCQAQHQRRSRTEIWRQQLASCFVQVHNKIGVLNSLGDSFNTRT